MVYGTIKKYTKKVYNGVKTANNVAAEAHKAYKTAMLVKKMVNAELKTFDTGNLTIAAGTTYYLNYIGQGNDYNQRNGNSIKAKSILQRLILSASTMTSSVARVRCILYRDFENKQATPSVTDLLETNHPLSPINHINGTRFKILFDETYQMVNSINSPQYTKVLVKYIPLKQRPHMKYASTGTTVASADEGSVYFIIVTDDATGPAAILNTRIRYYDN